MSCGVILRSTKVKIKVRPIILNQIGIASVLLDWAIPEIFSFKHHIEASLIIIGTPNVDNIGDAILVLS